MFKADGIIGLIVICFGVGVILLTLGAPPAARLDCPSPTYMSRLVAAALIICGLLLFIKSAMGKGDKPAGFNASGKKKVISTILLCAITPLGLEYLGFMPMLLVSAFVFPLILKARLWVAALTSTLLIGAVYFIFHYGLQVQFPEGSLW